MPIEMPCKITVCMTFQGMSSRAFFFVAILFVALMNGFVSMQAQAAHAMALGYEPKYPADFKQFDYVNPTAPKGGEIFLAGQGNFDSFNPFLLKAVPAAGLSLLFDTLGEKSLDEPATVYGLLAEDMVLAADKLSVTFRLNAKAKFFDGTPVTVEDVKFSFDTLRSKAAHPQFGFYWADVKDAVVVDPRTIRFNFARRNSELHIIVSELQVFSRKWLAGSTLDKMATEPPIGSGPYLLDVDKTVTGRVVSYKRNPNYWASDLPVRRGVFNFDRITYRYYKDPTVRLEAFKAGEFDFLTENSAKLWSKNYKGDKFDNGTIRKTTFAHQNPQGMQAFVFNVRKPPFQDKRVRRAIGLAFDFEWSNRNLFEKQYVRSTSFFNNSELASNGLPQGDELKLLEQFRDKLAPEVFTKPWRPSYTEAPNSLRGNLLEAKALLAEAGWQFSEGALRNKEGKAMEVEILIYDKAFERIILPFARNLDILGIRTVPRIVDVALFKRRQERFEFEMMIDSFGTGMNPGNELVTRFTSKAAQEEGSDNSIGIKDPVVDALVEKILTSEKRSDLVTAVHALDRVLLQGDYLVPNWYIAYHRCAHYDKFDHPQKLPLYYGADAWVLLTWWLKGK